MSRQLFVATILELAASGVVAAQQSPGERIDALVQSAILADSFSGVVVVRDGQATIYELATGYADQGARRRNDLHTAFNLGSINKLFTTIAIRQLIQQGRIARDSTLGHYWPDYPNVEARKATVGQLLEHRAGLGGNIFDDPKGGTREQLRRNHDFLQLFAGQPMMFAPGTRRMYCNACYVVLGELVSRISGEEYSEYVRRHVWEPAGMSRTGYFPTDSLPPNTAIGYMRPEGGGTRVANTDLLPGRGSAAGGGYSTAADLLRLLEAMRSGTIAATGNADVGVAGGAPGLNALMEGSVAGRYDIVVLSNFDPPSAERLGSAIRKLLAPGY